MPHELGPSDAATPAVAADRRTIRRVAAVGAATVVATALATAGVAQGAGIDTPTPTPSVSPAAAPTTAPSPSASPTTSAAPQLKIQIAYNRVGRDLTLTFNFAGHVVEPLSTDGKPLTFPTPAKRDIGLGETLSWGDGTNSDVPITGRRCPAGAEPRVVHEIADKYQATKKYTKPGTYTVNYTYFACGLAGGKISGTLTVTIPK